MPTAPDANADPVVHLDVPNVVRRFAVIGHQPERCAVEPPANWGAPRLAADAAGGRQQHLGGSPSGDRVSDMAVEEADAAALAVVGGSVCRHVRQHCRD